MSSPLLPVEGACMCGQVRLKVSVPPIMTAACHCTGCQKLTASAFSLTAMFPVQGVEVTGDVAVGGLRRESKYEFCPNCLNWIITRPASMQVVNVRPAMFGIPAWSTPFIESCVSEKLPWARTSAVHSYPQFPPPEDYPRLLQEYAERAAP